MAKAKQTKTERDAEEKTYNPNVTTPYRARLSQLHTTRESFMGQYREINDFMSPRRGQYLLGDTQKVNDGSKKHQKIINGVAYDALRVVAAGMQGGLTSPSNPWFSLGLPDKNLMEFAPVRDWLHGVRNSMLTVFAQSNIYGALHGLYSEIAEFGTSAISLEEDWKTVLRCKHFTVGEYKLGLDERYAVDTLGRTFSMTAANMIKKFGRDRVSEKVISAATRNSGEEMFLCEQLIQPNDGKLVSFDRYQFMSIYMEKAPEDLDMTLAEEGYHTQPFAAPRWETVGSDTYGNGPGMDALGDCKQVQKMESDKLKAINKNIDPPMNAPTSMKGQGGTLIAGGINYVDTLQGGQKFEPAHEVRPNTAEIAAEIETVGLRIKRFFFNDLFLSILGSDKTMTATEVARRYEEKLIVLGPIIERLQAELLDIIISRTYFIMQNMGMIPPPPPELNGVPWRIKYISLLAQAQRMVGTSGIEQVGVFVRGLSETHANVVDKFDADEAVDNYSDMVGIPPSIIRTDEVVSAMRQQRAELQARQAQMDAAEQATGIMKTAGDTDTGNKQNALQRMVGE